MSDFFNIKIKDEPKDDGYEKSLQTNLPAPIINSETEKNSDINTSTTNQNENNSNNISTASSLSLAATTTTPTTENDNDAVPVYINKDLLENEMDQIDRYFAELDKSSTRNKQTKDPIEEESNYQTKSIKSEPIESNESTFAGKNANLKNQLNIEIEIQKTKARIQNLINKNNDKSAASNLIPPRDSNKSDNSADKVKSQSTESSFENSKSDDFMPKPINIKKEKVDKESAGLTINISSSHEKERENSSPNNKSNSTDNNKNDNIIKIPLVKDYGHKSLPPTTEQLSNTTNKLNNIFAKPIIVKCPADELLPKPIQEIKKEKSDERKRHRNEETTLHNKHKKIKREKEDVAISVAPLISDKERDLEYCAKILEKLKIISDYKNEKNFLYTSVLAVKPDVINNKNRSLLLPSRNVLYEYSSTTKVNYRELGFSIFPVCATNIARIIGLDVEHLVQKHSIKGNNINIKLEKNATEFRENNCDVESSYFFSISTQTDQAYCDTCISSQNKSNQRKYDIETQTEIVEELPIIKNFYNLNINQQLALNSFYEEICESRPVTANDKLRLRERLLTIFDSSCPPEVPITYKNTPVVMSAAIPTPSHYYPNVVTPVMQNFEIPRQLTPQPDMYQQQPYMVPQQYAQQQQQYNNSSENYAQHIRIAENNQHLRTLPETHRNRINDPRIRPYNACSPAQTYNYHNNRY